MATIKRVVYYRDEDEYDVTLEDDVVARCKIGLGNAWFILVDQAWCPLKKQDSIDLSNYIYKLRIGTWYQ